MFGDVGPRLKKLFKPATRRGDLLVYNGGILTPVAVGTNNQVLTADSTQATGIKWAAVATEPSPNTSVVADEFFNGYKNSTLSHLVGNAFMFDYTGSSIAETYDGGGAGYEEINHPGVFYIAGDSGNGATYGRLRHLPANAGTIQMKTLYGSRVGFLIKVNNTTAARYWFGFAADQTATTPAVGAAVGFRYDNSSQGDTEWMAYCGSSTAATGVAPGTTWKFFEIEFVSSSSIKFYINGSLVVTRTTDIPTDTQALGLFLLARNTTTGASNQARIILDYMQWRFSGTRYS